MHKQLCVYICLTNLCCSIIVLSGIIAADCDHCWFGTLERAVSNLLQWPIKDAVPPVEPKPVAPPAVKRRNRRRRRRRGNTRRRAHSNAGYESDTRTMITYVADTNRSPSPNWDRMVFGNDRWSGSEADSHVTDISYERMRARGDLWDLI